MLHGSWGNQKTRNMHNDKKILESSMKVRFHDCDPFNHLNNSRYMDYIMAARTEQLQDNYGLDVHGLAIKKGIGWVSAQTQLSYLVPVSLMEAITIQTRLLAYSDKSLLFEGLIWNKDKTTVKAVMWTKLVHFHLAAQKSHPHEQELMVLFEQVVNPLDTGMDFEARIKQLKNTP